MATWRAVVTAIAALACGLSVWACTPRIDGGTNAGHPTLAFEGNPPEWADSGASVMAELERWRGLEFQTDVRVSFLSQSEPGLNGWYNSQTKQLVVATTESAQLGRSVLLHELFHALQDQSFNLYALRQQSVETPDANQTLSAIIEGEAMLAVSELLNYDFLAHAQLPKTDSLRDERFNNIFLYGDGMKFVMAVRDAGGWDAVDRLFQDPPRSTALIFNPERYLAGEREIEGVDVPLAPGDRLQSQSVRGEYQVRLLLARQPDTRSLLDAMDGAYVSDTFGTIEAADGTTLHRWVIAFSSADIAQTIEPGITTAIVRDLQPETPLSSAIANGTQIIVEWQSP